MVGYDLKIGVSKVGKTEWEHSWVVNRVTHRQTVTVATLLSVETTVMLGESKVYSYEFNYTPEVAKGLMGSFSLLVKAVKENTPFSVIIGRKRVEHKDGYLKFGLEEDSVSIPISPDNMERMVSMYENQISQMEILASEHSEALKSIGMPQV